MYRLLEYTFNLVQTINCPASIIKSHACTNSKVYLFDQLHKISISQKK